MSAPPDLSMLEVLRSDTRICPLRVFFTRFDEHVGNTLDYFAMPRRANGRVQPQPQTQPQPQPRPQDYARERDPIYLALYKDLPYIALVPGSHSVLKEWAFTYLKGFFILYSFKSITNYENGRKSIMCSAGLVYPFCAMLAFQTMSLSATRTLVKLTEHISTLARAIETARKALEMDSTDPAQLRVDLTTLNGLFQTKLNHPTAALEKRRLTSFSNNFTHFKPHVITVIRLALLLGLRVGIAIKNPVNFSTELAGFLASLGSLTTCGDRYACKTQDDIVLESQIFTAAQPAPSPRADVQTAGAPSTEESGAASDHVDDKVALLSSHQDAHAMHRQGVRGARGAHSAPGASGTSGGPGGPGSPGSRSFFVTPHSLGHVTLNNIDEVSRMRRTQLYLLGDPYRYNALPSADFSGRLYTFPEEQPRHDVSEFRQQFGADSIWDQQVGESTAGSHHSETTTTVYPADAKRLRNINRYEMLAVEPLRGLHGAQATVTVLNGAVGASVAHAQMHLMFDVVVLDEGVEGRVLVTKRNPDYLVKTAYRDVYLNNKVAKEYPFLRRKHPRNPLAGEEAILRQYPATDDNRTCYEANIIIKLNTLLYENICRAVSAGAALKPRQVLPGTGLLAPARTLRVLARYLAGELYMEADDVL